MDGHAALLLCFAFIIISENALVFLLLGERKRRWQKHKPNIGFGNFSATRIFVVR